MKLNLKPGASTATISRVNRSLPQFGAEGYELVLDELIARDLKGKTKVKFKTVCVISIRLRFNISIFFNKILKVLHLFLNMV